MPGRRTPGHSVGLTREAVLRAALALADREGLKALSMRRLGAELGVEAMTIYHHVPNKDALLDGLVELLVAPIAPPAFEAASWQEGLHGYARALRTTLLAHPNVVALVASRPAVTAQNLQVMEAALESMRAAGLQPADALDVLYAVTGFVVGHVVTAPAPADDPVDHLATLDPAEFPLLAEAVRAASPPGADARFEFALEALLSGLRPDALD
ncbi:TetR family transcriptional regulator [Kribbella steppae]|uniref:TetR family transcriptional regulator n=1 Tax=Kribbella steppae TaxID=2512223 RepID=A0A4R2HXF2_9ACTN|nr:TetR/AcrR family transcriptional regulator C-terminal domain-containing protein [Kribbella steppae]TCO35789.1 TetR family transcriptional regulator [Kribbella steppae]